MSSALVNTEPAHQGYLWKLGPGDVVKGSLHWHRFPDTWWDQERGQVWKLAHPDPSVGFWDQLLLLIQSLEVPLRKQTLHITSQRLQGLLSMPASCTERFICLGSFCPLATLWGGESSFLFHRWDDRVTQPRSGGGAWDLALELLASQLRPKQPGSLLIRKRLEACAGVGPTDFRLHHLFPGSTGSWDSWVGRDCHSVNTRGSHGNCEWLWGWVSQNLTYFFNCRC